ncbi:hypothetical protein ICN41_09015 [Polynucleobacter sp. 15G-AUS-farblos]|uniref:hypothetical protein n=1 Tax=Polynucleobacter sp. 15G-AUS-farblos TaxID=2689094 RepID=UPI001C0E48C1|nr:hypothetical protein [Polynucleobacter sp. 15G-AUS-farblos]MBU3584124.1 hypothetical protein [Polynucleobacter sp. 15G-AUS-farblos]
MSFSLIKSLSIKALFLILGVYYFGLTIKLPNWRWMEQKLDPHFGMLETGLPFFRPWLPVERFEWSLHQSNWYSDNLTYGLLAGWMFYLIYRNASSIFSFVLLAAPLSLVVWYTANGGTLYDITAAFSLTYLLVIFRNGSKSDSYWVLAGIGLLMAILDHSRPFAFQICVLMTLYGIYLYRAKFLVALAVFALLVAPFHINQMKKFETFELSTYGGNNLVEAFQGVIPFATDCYYLEMSKRLGTRDGAICALENKKKILGELKRNPKLILGVFTPERIKKVFFPELVWHATGLDPNSPKQVEIRDWFHIYLALIYLLAIITLIRKTERPYKLLIIAIYAYIVLITFMANRLSETIRVLMPSLTALVLLCQTYFPKPKDQ